MNLKRLRGFLLLAGLLPAALPAADAPGGVSISPVRVDLAAQQHAAAITVSNAGSEDKLIQVETMQWSHPDGSDHYELSRELVANPPLFRLPPGGSQVVRIGLARQARPDASKEKDFRIFFQELPKTDAGSAQSQLRILLRIGVPVFVAPLQAAAPDLYWQLVRNADDLELHVQNRGGVHQRLTNIRLNDAKDAGAVAQVDGFAYVLPGQSRHWTLKPPGETAQAETAGKPVIKAGDTRLVLHAVGEAGAIHAELPLPAR